MALVPKAVSIALLVLVGTGAAVSVSIFAATRFGAPGVEPEHPASASVPEPGMSPKPAPAPTMAVDRALKELALVRPSQARRVEDFTLPTLDGKSFRLSAYRGKIVLVNFWATWCHPCLEEMPAMERLYRKQKDQGFVLAAVSLDADPGVVPAFVKKQGLTFPILVDPRSDVANLYRVRALPSTFIVDREGNMAALALGPRPWDGPAALALVHGMLR